MIFNFTRKLLTVLLTCSLLSMVAVASGTASKTYDDTRKLLSAMNSLVINRGELKTLFEVGDTRISDLLWALDDQNSEVSKRA